MGFNKFIKKKSGIVWASLSGLGVILATAVSIVLPTTLKSFLDGFLGPQPILDPSVEPIYKSDYNNKMEVLEAGKKLNVEIEKEGAVLLLNEVENNKRALPLAKNAKISVFGKNSAHYVTTGSGSGDAGSEGAISLYEGLEKSGFNLNPTLKSFYESEESGKGRGSNPTLSDASSEAPTLPIGETPISSYGKNIRDSFREYSDAAIVVISRIGGESFDLPRSQDTSNGGIAGNHYLQLDQNEYDLLDMVTSSFDHVIVMLNTLTSFQLDFIDQYNNLDGLNRIDAVLWIGGPGLNGAEAIGSILNGETNPSGRTSDIYVRDFKKDPTWKNFGDNTQNWDGKNGTAFAENGHNVAKQAMVSYEEGVYVGYKYYETRGYEELQKDPDSKWYEESVVFPFGYGLSYTTFDQEFEIAGTLKEGIDVTVTSTNIGEVRGKDVIELYVQLPYTQGGIEKSAVQLIDYAKTGLLEPGASETISFHFDAYDFASYDYNDANHNDFIGYETESGPYTFYLGKNSHVLEDAYDSLTIESDEHFTFRNDPVTNEVVENLYTGNENYLDDIDYRLSDVFVTDIDGIEYTRKGMSRTDFEGTFPTAPDIDEREYMDNEKARLTDFSHNNEKIESVTEMPKMDQDTALKLRDLAGLDYNDEKWNELLDALSFDDMLKLVNEGAFQTAPILKIEKNQTNDSDGPVGFVNFIFAERYKNNPTFASEIVIASTYNKDLAYKMGKMVGESGLYGDVSTNLPYSGWYAPAVNIHRSPFSGRNYEYYSEDPILSGKMAVNVINGARQKGVYADLKHFALNDQETNRNCVSTFTTEQALREIYLKPFEIAVKGLDNPKFSTQASEDGIEKFVGATGIMSSFNRIGNKWTGGDYRLMTKILRNEWGFHGLVICDYKTDNDVMDAKQMVYAGNDLILASLPQLLWNTADKTNAKDVTVLRTATHNILYTVANSNSVNVKIIGYTMATWVILLIVFDSLIALLIATFAIIGSVRNKEVVANIIEEVKE